MLNKSQIEGLIKAKMIEDYTDLSLQLQPAGFDVTVATVSEFKTAGKVDFDNKERRLSKLNELQPNDDGWWFLTPGVYFVTYAELTTIPLNVVALARPRSSMLRSGVTVDTGVWDPGYSGRAGSLMTVFNPAGLWLKHGSRIVQLIFFPIDATSAYAGVYQGERK